MQETFDWIIDEIEEVIDGGVCDEYVYDIGMYDTPHTFFANDILVHNSVFIKMQEVLEYNNIDITDDDACKKKILELVPILYKHINSSFDIFCKESMNMEKHFIEFKQEYIIKSGMWVKKKNYIQHLINKKGKDINSIDVKGLSVVRSSFAPAFKGTMTRVLHDMLNYVEKPVIEEYLRDFKFSMKDASIQEIANPTSLKEISKYTTKDGSYRFLTKTPAHVKAGLQYNWFIHHNKLEDTYPKLSDGDKIKWVYLQDNPFGFESLAFKGYDDPPALMEFIDTYKDYSKTYDSVFVTKIQSLYDVLNWGTINLNKNKKKYYIED